MYYNAFMDKIKSPSVAGTFYPADKEELNSIISNFKQNLKTECKYSSRAVIVPHAGLVYSGQLAFDTLSILDKNIKTLFIFAPTHRVGFPGLCLSSYDEWETPLGNIEINQEINQELNENFFLDYFDEAFAEEHAIEIQLPLIQSIFNNINIVPILVGQADINSVLEIIMNYWNNKDIGFVISSDLSHFLEDKDARKIDLITAEMIESGNISQFSYKQACGAIGVCALTAFASSQKYSLIRNGLINSSIATGDKSRVVGYGGWFLYEGEVNEYLKKYYSEEIKSLCKEAIVSKLEDRIINNIDLPSVFEEKMACFVTLEKQNNLRGCIGSIIAHQSLKEDLIHNARAAAFNDPRFNPLDMSEIEYLSIAISLLSAPSKMNFKNEEDLLNQIVPFKDGIIIKDKGYQAVYLPSVWDQLPDKKQFLNSLKLKAGMSADYFSETFEAYRFYSEYIK